MARKPAHLERVGALTPRDRMWAAIRALVHVRPGVANLQFIANVQFSGAEVALLSGQNVDTTMSYIAGLIKAGYIDVFLEGRPASAKPKREFHLLQLVRDVGVEAPRVNRDGKLVTAGLANLQMWNTLRHWKGDFNALDIALAASTPAQGVTEENAVFYCQYLRKAGYLVVTAPSKPGTKARFKFVKARNSGPRAPLIQRDKSVMDANTGEVVWPR